jgi:U3 small nucleolar RNA-associated protein 11
MSSLRNAVKRVTHKERGQLQKRAHLGMLEKKSDYKKRADNYHKREQQTKALKELADMKNPDEFYFGMNNAQVTNDGQHKKTAQAKQYEFEQNVGHDTIRIMKDQDLSYIRLQKAKDMKQVEKLQESLHYIEENNTKKRKHTIFVSSKEDVENFDIVKHFDTVPELVDRAFNRPRISTLVQNAVNQTTSATNVKTKEQLRKEFKEQSKIIKKATKERNASYRELQERKKRIESMKLAESHLVTEKLLASKGRKRKIQEGENGRPALYKWRRKRLS